jgi:hypothetical protein
MPRSVIPSVANHSVEADFLRSGPKDLTQAPREASLVLIFTPCLGLVPRLHPTLAIQMYQGPSVANHTSAARAVEADFLRSGTEAGRGGPLFFRAGRPLGHRGAAPPAPPPARAVPARTPRSPRRRRAAAGRPAARAVWEPRVGAAGPPRARAPDGRAPSPPLSRTRAQP